MFWSCFPLDLTVDRDTNDRLFCSRQGRHPQLTTSHTARASPLFSLRFDRSLNIQGWSFLVFSPFSSGTMTSMHKNQTERNTNIGSRLGLYHSTDFALNYGDKLLSRHYSYLRWACASQRKVGIWWKNDYSAVPRLPFLPPLPLVCVQGNLNVIFLFFISFLWFLGSTLFILMGQSTVFANLIWF